MIKKLPRDVAAREIETDNSQTRTRLTKATNAFNNILQKWDIKEKKINTKKLVRDISTTEIRRQVETDNSGQTRTRLTKATGNYNGLAEEREKTRWLAVAKGLHQAYAAREGEVYVSLPEENRGFGSLRATCPSAKGRQSSLLPILPSVHRSGFRTCDP